ncbi:MAG: C-terminal target protein [Ferruginibacter sp.]|nr:C-terminal target protein [Ferruginibacter sp.]
MQKIILFLACIILLVPVTRAQWDANPATVNNPVTTNPNGAIPFFSVIDGAGGAIVVWSGADQAPTSFVYAQRKSSSGQVLWGTAATPKQLFTSAHNSYITDLVEDGAGGAYITWVEQLTDTTSNVFIQHINSSGTELFTAGGLRLNSANGQNNNFARVVSDAAGVIVAWTTADPDSIITVDYFAQVYVQRFTGAGAPQWTAGGVPVCTVPGQRHTPVLLGDGSNGVFIAFGDARNSTIDVIKNKFINVDIYAQHISSSGARLWGAGGLVVTDQLYNQETLISFFSNAHPIVSDGSGGFIVVYNDYRNDNNGKPRLYAQRLNSSGVQQWVAQGIALSTNPLTFTTGLPNLVVVSDGASGAVVAWNESLIFSGVEHAQRITGAGTLSWGTNGITVNPATDIATGAYMATDANGDYIFCWSGINFSNEAFVRAQKINNAGAPLWDAAGVPVCTNPDSGPIFPGIIKSDGTNMILFWIDSRNVVNGNDNTDIYAAKLSTSGALIGTIAPAGYTTANDGNWNDPATWVGNAVPPVGVDVVVKHLVNGNLTTTCNTLKVQSPGSLTVNTGVKITVLH